MPQKCGGFAAPCYSIRNENLFRIAIPMAVPTLLGLPLVGGFSGGVLGGDGATH